MPIDPEFVRMLVCPETRVPMRWAAEDELARINERIATGKALNRGGEAVREPLEQGLVPEGSSIVYPVREEIPILLRQEAIPIDESAAAGQG